MGWWVGEFKIKQKMHNENKRSIETVVAESELLYCENFVNAMLIFDFFFCRNNVDFP